MHGGHLGVEAGEVALQLPAIGLLLVWLLVLVQLHLEERGGETQLHAGRVQLKRCIANKRRALQQAPCNR